MIIDGKSIRPSEAKAINSELDRAWDNPHAIRTESPAVFLELTDGPDSVEALVGGGTLHIHNRKAPTPVYLEEVLSDESGAVISRRTTDVACGPLFQAAAERSPIDRIQTDQDRHLIITALQFAAAESDRLGFPEQTAEFRRLWQELSE